MADIRINALATTAASTASDDFLAVDGSANGTRKLNAYSPTFGGNLTVSGTGTSSFGGLVKATGNATTSFGVEIANGAGFSGTAQYYLTAGNGAGFTAFRLLRGNGAAGYEDNGFNADSFSGARFNLNALGGSGGNFTISGGNLTVSGTGTSSFAGKIQTTSANGIEAIVGSGNTGVSLQSGSTQYSLYLNAADNSYRLYSSLGGDRFAVSSGGNLLIGTTTDRSNRVHIAAAGPSYIGMGQLTSTYAGIVFGDVTLADSASGFNIAGNAANSNLVFNVNTGGSMNWRVGNANAFTLSSGSNFLIGTTTDVGPRLLSKAKDNTYAGSGIGIVDQSAGTSYITRANGTFYISNNGSTDHFALDASGNATFAGKVVSSASSASHEAFRATNTNTAGQVYINLNETNTTATPAYLIRYGSTHATKPSYVELVNGTLNAPITLITSGTAGVNVKGTATNDNAAAGYVGEYVSSTVASGSAVSLTTATAANVTSISLTAGDWDVEANIFFAQQAGTTSTYLIAGLNSTSATIPSNNDGGRYNLLGFSGDAADATSKPSRRYSLSATTTIYVVAQAGFSGGTCSAFGQLSARRVR